jgi:hypothetical protein
MNLQTGHKAAMATWSIAWVPKPCYLARHRHHGAQEMTPAEFEQIRTTARIIALESALAVLLIPLTRSQGTRESVLSSLNHLITTPDSVRYPEGSPAYTDVIHGETEDAIAALVAFLKDQLKNH